MKTLRLALILAFAFAATLLRATVMVGLITLGFGATTQAADWSPAASLTTAR